MSADSALIIYKILCKHAEVQVCTKFMNQSTQTDFNTPENMFSASYLEEIDENDTMVKLYTFMENA